MFRWMKLRRHKVRKPRVVIAEARRAHLPLPDALAMLEQETGIPQHNIFGGDCSSPPCHYHQRVTHDRVIELLRSPYANGVGWTQLTYKPFVSEAERLGGAHLPKYQMRVGFKVLADNIRSYGVQEGHARYNGTGSAAEEYGRVAVELRRKWQRILG